MKKLNYIDLFAGCGGISLGLYNSGQWHGVFAVEKSPDAFMTLHHNLIQKKNHFSWPNWLSKQHHDIKELLENHKESLKALKGCVDLVVGGPPCQGFSMAGRRKENDNRNNLAFSYLEMIELIQPKAILFENVKGFNIGFNKSIDPETGELSRSKPMAEIVLEKLHKLGYADAHGEEINFSEFGVPQSRTRFIIAATKNGTSNLFFDRLKQDAPEFKQKKGLTDKTPLSESISDLLMKHGTFDSPDTKRFKAGKYGRKSSPYQELMRQGSENQYPDSHRFVNHTKKITERFREVIKKQLSANQIRERFNTKKSSTKLLNADLPTPTLTTLPDDYIHYCEPRILTVREYARIQSFPDWYEFKGKYTTGGPRRKLEVPRYSQIGNAIPPFFGEIAGQIIKELLDEI